MWKDVDDFNAEIGERKNETKKGLMESKK